jgi:hypothetical protein
MLPTSMGLCLSGGGFLINIQCFKITSEMHQIDYKLVWMCSYRPQESNITDATEKG